MEAGILLGLAVDLAVVAAATLLAALHIVPGAAVLSLFGAVLGARARNLGDGGGPADPVVGKAQARPADLRLVSGAVALAFVPLGLFHRARRAFAHGVEPRHVAVAAYLAMVAALLSVACGTHVETTKPSTDDAGSSFDVCMLSVCVDARPESWICEQVFGPGWYAPIPRKPCAMLADLDLVTECGCELLDTQDETLGSIKCCHRPA